MNRKALCLTASLIVATTLVGCAQTTPPQPAPSAGVSGQQLPAPIILEPSALAGKQVSISLQIPLVVRINDDTALAKWTGSVADSSVATFVPGGQRNGASFNPGFTGVKVGSTAATLTGPDGKVVAFTLTVVADNKDVTRTAG